MATEHLAELEKAQLIHARLGTWVSEFPQVLHRALQETEGLPTGWVWQDRFATYFQRYDLLQSQLRELKVSTEPPRQGRVAHAIGILDFFPHPHSGHELIAYRVDRLQEWFRVFSAWTKVSSQLLDGLVQEVRS